MTIDASNLKLFGGVLCLDFVNTRHWRPDQRPYDFLTSYHALLQLSLQLGVLNQPQAEQLFQLAEKRQDEAQAALEKAIRFREATYKIFSAIAQKANVSANDLATLNSVLATRLAHLQMASEGGKFTWAWMNMDESLESMLWPLSQSTAELLASEGVDRVRSCDGCGWFFLDTSGGRRRWCDMKICGNRAKSRQHFASEKAKRKSKGKAP